MNSQRINIYPVAILPNIVALALLAVWSPADADNRPPQPGAVSIETASATTDTGQTIRYELGTLHVPENRAAAKTRVIEIGFARIKAARATQAPPLVVLPGGPGVSLLDAFTETTPRARRRLALYRQLSAAADVIVLDQRGFSKRGTTLAVPSLPPAPLDRPSTVQATTAAWSAFAKAAVAANPDRDLSAYNIVECAADVGDLRKALGYPKLSLLGGSFGSQWSFAVMRLHPDIVARAILLGVEPLDDGFDMPSQVFAAMQRIAFDADRAASLRPYLPAGGVMAAVRALRDRFARGPVTVRVTDAKTGKPEAVVLDLGDLQAALVPEDAEAWPAFVLSLYHGHYDDWARSEIAHRRAPLFESMINPLIDSGLGGSPARLHLLQTDPATHFLGTWNFEPHIGSRAAWPSPDLGDALRAPATSPIPVVFLNGDWDTSTPLENMLHIAPYFPNGRTIIVHRAEHAGLGRLLGNHPGALDAIIEFVRSGTMAGLPSEITLAPPVFTVPGFSPPGTRTR